jgi:hypothetical protein
LNGEFAGPVFLSPVMAEEDVEGEGWGGGHDLGSL